MDELKRDLNFCCPRLIATFEKTKGDADQLAPGDEFLVRLAAPWNAPVRVTRVTDTSFRLATLEGHPEAGEIEFRIQKLEDGRTRFEIESWARSRDKVIEIIYDRLPFARMMQTTMWFLFCEAFVRSATGEFAEHLGIVTEIFDPETSRWTPA